MKRLSLALALAFACALPSPAAVLYKSVGPNGTLEFSDLPPEKGRAAQQIRIADSETPSATGAPIVVGSMPNDQVAMYQADAAVARASAQLDLAEHALAQARRGIWSDDLVRLQPVSATRTDIERIEFYKKNVLAARQTLLEVVAQQRKASVRQTMTASNEWTPVYSGASVSLPADRR